jgi:predicted nucleic acid-binding protein
MLTKIECLIGIRRAGALQNLASDGPWCMERIRLLEAYVEELDCKRIDDEILDIIRKNLSLSNCRSLDAIHVATALYFKPYHDEPIQIVTLDNRMRETAGKAGFTVLPS